MQSICISQGFLLCVGLMFVQEPTVTTTHSGAISSRRNHPFACNVCELSTESNVTGMQTIGGENGSVTLPVTSGYTSLQSKKQMLI